MSTSPCSLSVEIGFTCFPVVQIPLLSFLILCIGKLFPQIFLSANCGRANYPLITHNGNWTSFIQGFQFEHFFLKCHDFKEQKLTLLFVSLKTIFCLMWRIKQNYKACQIHFFQFQFSPENTGFDGESAVIRNCRDFQKDDYEKFGSHKFGYKWPWLLLLCLEAHYPCFHFWKLEILKTPVELKGTGSGN